MGYSDGRKQVQRILDMAALLQTSRSWRVANLAKLYCVDQSRIYADLKVLEELFVLKKDKGVYWIEGERPRFTKREVNALTAAINASPFSKGSPFEKPLKKGLEKLHWSLAKHIQSKIEKQVAVSIQLKTGNHYEAIEGNFKVLEEAICKQKVVHASYQPAGKEEPVAHVLHPYAIFFRKEDWYLEARSNMSENASLTFKILRFQKVELTDETFELPPDFSLSENLGSRWELFSGEPINITLKIAAHKAYLVEEKERHQSQEIVERCADGCCGCPL